MRALSLITVLVALCACSDDGFGMIADLKTDLVAGEEFDGIRVVLERLGAVGLLQLGLVGAPRDTQDFVVVAPRQWKGLGGRRWSGAGLEGLFGSFVRPGSIGLFPSELGVEILGHLVGKRREFVNGGAERPDVLSGHRFAGGPEGHLDGVPLVVVDVLGERQCRHRLPRSVLPTDVRHLRTLEQRGPVKLQIQSDTLS